MFLIYATDAPLYHYPIVTVAMVVLNVVIHTLIVATGFDASPYYLYFGDGFHPLQWLTHNFLHGGPMLGWPHLIFNMIFLWPFGMIIEGKIGWARMLVLYLAIATFQGFTQQLVMLPTDPQNHAAEFVRLLNDPDHPMSAEEKQELQQQFRRDLLRSGSCSLGASAVIFGLMAICAIWAPENEFESYFRWSLLIRASDGGIRDWTVLTVCLMFIVKEAAMYFMRGGALSSEALHLNGFVAGLAFGLAMLYFGMVDCEGYDLISMVTGEKFKAARTIEREQRERRAAAEAARPSGPPQAVVPQMPHQVAQQLQAQWPAPPTADALFIPEPSPPPSVPLQPVDSPEIIFPGDIELPDFDDATSDRLQQVRSEIETDVARGQFSAALKRFAAQRKSDRSFVVAPAAMGKLAEGLIRQNKVKPALTVLAMGADAYPAYAPRWRIRAAIVELNVNQDPIAAIKLLRAVDKGMLDQATRTQFLKVAKRAKEMAGG